MTMKLPLPRSRGAWFRVALGVGAVAVLGYYVMLFVFNRVAIDGRVNGEIVAVPAQIDGVLVGALPPRGTRVHRGQVLGVIDNPRADDRSLNEIVQAFQAAEQRLASLDALHAGLVAEQESLARRAEAHQSYQIRHLQDSGRELAAARGAAAAQRAEAQAALARAATLLALGDIAPARHETLRHQGQQAAARVAEVDATIARNSSETEAARHGLSLSDTYADVPYTRQRLDDIGLRLLTLQSERDDLVSQLASLDTRRQAEAVRLEQTRRQVLVAPVDGVVWDSGASAGGEVMRGTTLVGLIDCRRVFVEAAVYERFIERIAVGQRAEVTLMGGGPARPARVRTILGSAATWNEGGHAVTGMRKNPGEAKVILDLADDATPDAARMCDVGRVAAVAFGRTVDEATQAPGAAELSFVERGAR